MSSILYSDEDEITDDENIQLNPKNRIIEFSNQEISEINTFNMTSKFWAGIDLVRQLLSEGKQVLVWAIFIDTIKRIKQELQHLNIQSEIVYGEIPLINREQIIEDFQNKKIRVLITNPHTLAESVSLHETCHDAVYFEYSFNLTHMLQSRDRINRLGLPANQYTQYYYLFLFSDIPGEDTIDLKTYDRLKEKEAIMLKAIEEQRLESINFDIMDDIRTILLKN